MLRGIANLLLVIAGTCTALSAAALMPFPDGPQPESRIILGLIAASGVLLALPSIRPTTYLFRQYRQLGQPGRRRYEDETSVNGLPLKCAIIEGKIYRDDNGSKTLNSSLEAINSMLTNGRGDLDAFVAIIKHLACMRREYIFWERDFYEYAPRVGEKESDAIKRRKVYYFSPEFSRRETYAMLRDDILKAGKQEFAKWLLNAGI